MKLSGFDTMKEFLTEETRQEFNADCSVTKLNVNFDILEKTDLFSVQSVEDDYIERQNVAEDFRTLDNAVKVLDSCPTKISEETIHSESRERLIYPRNRREIGRFPAHGSGFSRARREKNNFFRKTPKNTSQNPQENYISERTANSHTPGSART